MPTNLTPSTFPPTNNRGAGTPSTRKRVLRAYMKDRVSQLSSSAKVAASLRISLHASQVVEFSQSKTLAFFTPHTYEPDLSTLMAEATAQGKRILLPRICALSSAVVPAQPNSLQSKLEWREIPSRQLIGGYLVPGPFVGINEPNPDLCPLIDPDEIDCAFVPGLAFDSLGFRLGRGGGYYDRFISEASQSPTKTHFFGIMFDCQMLGSLPSEPHDQRLSCVITESGMHHFSYP